MNFGGNVLNGGNQTNDSPEAISKAVACLPAGQMFELMIQMKGCIQNNPLEARTMLAKNPQLTYALLHAQILLNIVDTKDFVSTGIAIPTTPAIAAPASIKTEPGLTQQPLINNTIPQPVPAPSIPGLGGLIRSSNVSQSIPVPVQAPTMVQQQSLISQQPIVSKLPNISIVLPQQPNIVQQKPTMVPAPQTNVYSDMDFRTTDPRILRNSGDQDMRNMVARASTESNIFPADPRSRPPEVARNDPRLSKGIVPSRTPLNPNPARQMTSAAPSAPTSDQDKTALIMQVLQLSDEQIALLPPDQRASILLLKEQIARSTQR